MQLDLTDDHRAVRDAVTALFAKEASFERIRATATGFDERCWTALVAMGVPAMGAPAERGGGDATLVDLVVVCEAAGAAVAPAPLVEAAVAARLLARLAETSEAAADELHALVDDGAVVVFAPRPSDGATFTLVDGGAVARTVIGLHRDEIVAVPGTEAVPPENLGARPLADIDCRDAITLATGEVAANAFALALDEWRVLSAAFAAGVGRQALSIGVDYVTERIQFDVPIGSFQSVQHRLADLATALDGSTLLARKAAWALATGHHDDDADASALAAMAHAFCCRTAVDAAAWSLHYHGGYGFMTEYDVTLCFRRAKALELSLGDPADALATVACRLWGPPLGVEMDVSTRPSPPVVTDDHARAALGVDFRLGEASDAFRSEVRAFLAEHLTAEIIDRARTTGTMHDWGLHRALAAKGWLAASWPEAYGGQGRDPLQMLALSEELYLASAPIDGMGIAAMVAHTLLHEGTEGQKRDVLPRIIGGEVMLCLGYSEPDAGSDVAAVVTRAVRDGDEWIIDGQKMFTTMAHEAQYVFLLCRTNLEVPKHKGLTMFLVPMDTPGIEITPVETLGGERTNITFYTGVRVPDAARVGPVDGGWGVMMTALVFERNSANWGESVRLLRTAAAWAASATRRDGRRVIDLAANRERLARLAIGNEVARLLGYRAAWLASRGELPAVEGSMAKLFTSETFQSGAAAMLDMAGEAGQLGHVDAAPAGGAIEHAYRHSQVTTIYGGSSEIQRGIIAERGLRLPRAR